MSESATPATAIRSRLTLRRLLIALLAAVLGLLVWGLVWWLRYAPLEVVNSIGGEGPRVVIYGFRITNTGRFDVRVDAIDGPQVPGIFTHADVTMLPRGARADSTDHRQFRPFTLEPGEERWVFVRGQTSCTPTLEGRTAVAEVQRVRFRVLSLTKTRDFPLFHPVELTPSRQTCSTT